jgi:hypothetical protein
MKAALLRRRRRNEVMADTEWLFFLLAQTWRRHAMYEANRGAILAVDRREAFSLVAMLSCKALPPSRFSRFACRAPLEVVQSRRSDGRRVADLKMPSEGYHRGELGAGPIGSVCVRVASRATLSDSEELSSSVLL